jgi:rhamnulokinase
MAGPQEASALGNILMQYIALGHFKDLGQARAAVRRSFPPKEYYPATRQAWDRAYQGFRQVTNL